MLHRNAISRDRQANDHLRQITALVFRIATLLQFGFDFGFKITARGVEQDQVDFKIQKIGNRPIDFLFNVFFVLKQKIHCPIANLDIQC